MAIFTKSAEQPNITCQNQAVIGNKLSATVFTQILLLFIASFAILFQIERSTMRTSYLFVTHITLDDFPIASFNQHKF